MNEPNAPLPPSPPVPSSPPARRGMSPALMLVLGCGAFLTLGFLGIFVLAMMSGDHSSIDDAAVLRLKLSGDVPEYVRTSGFDELFGSPPVTVREHLENLKKAAADKRIKGVFVELEPLSIGYAKVEELRDALTAFKKSGKFVIVYSEYLSEKEYALALAADEIVMPKDSWFEFNGLATDIAHYPGLLEKAGIEVQYFRYGKYKSVSGEQSGRKAFSEPVKEMINENLAVVYGHLVDAIAAARKLDKAEVERLIEESGLKADWAFEHKLIDRLAYYDEVEATLRGKLGLAEDKKVPFVSAGRYRGVSPSEAGLKDGEHTFALIYSVGLIVSGKGESGAFGGDGTQGSEPIIRALRKAAEDEDVKAIIFRVDSPGGAGLGCDYVRREIERVREKKPVVVSMSDVAASGGYWVSMDASAIVAQPSTATGSIGIYSVVPSLGGLYEKLGLNNETFKKGAHADALIAARLMSEDEAKRFDDDLKRSYDRFVELAAKGRDMNVEAMQEVAQGRTWYGSQAVRNGLVDRLGGFDEAIALAKEKAKLPADATVKLESFDKRRSWLEELTDRDEDDEESPELGRALVKQVVEASGLGPLMKKAPFFSAYARTVLEGKEHLFPMMELHVDYR
ncbi:MAG: signal peptide peptidase SppA [Myxococcota bacterium]